MAWLLIPVGILLLIYTKPVGDFIGELDLADKYFGGVYNFVKVAGLGFIILAFLLGTGAAGSIMRFFFGPFFGGF
jgi:hypothetical protein